MILETLLHYRNLSAEWFCSGVMPRLAPWAPLGNRSYPGDQRSLWSLLCFPVHGAHTLVWSGSSTEVLNVKQPKFGDITESVNDVYHSLGPGIEFAVKHCLRNSESSFWNCSSATMTHESQHVSSLNTGSQVYIWSLRPSYCFPNH